MRSRKTPCSTTSLSSHDADLRAGLSRQTCTGSAFAAEKASHVHRR
ncbi:MAG: hypothetical protein MZV64_01705 [Ignavibacteriales bacterium]|nr:hypothetical protein [Ignavibacteriales bacterium]